MHPRCGLWDFNEINSVNLTVLTHSNIRAGKQKIKTPYMDKRYKRSFHMYTHANSCLIINLRIRKHYSIQKIVH